MAEELILEYDNDVFFSIDNINLTNPKTNNETETQPLTSSCTISN